MQGVRPGRARVAEDRDLIAGLRKRGPAPGGGQPDFSPVPGSLAGLTLRPVVEPLVEQARREDPHICEEITA